MSTALPNKERIGEIIDEIDDGLRNLETAIGEARHWTRTVWDKIGELADEEAAAKSDEAWRRGSAP